MAPALFRSGPSALRIQQPVYWNSSAITPTSESGPLRFPRALHPAISQLLDRTRNALSPCSPCFKDRAAHGWCRRFKTCARLCYNGCPLISQMQAHGPRLSATSALALSAIREARVQLRGPNSGLRTRSSGLGLGSNPFLVVVQQVRSLQRP